MLNRFNGNVVPFAVNSTATNRTVFGDTAQSDDIDDNLNADFKTGWEIVGINDNPTKQDFNGLAFTLGNLISYLYQQGLATWNTTQKYYVNSICLGSNGKIYRAKTGTEPTPNTGNNPTTDSTNWEWILGDMVDKSTAQTIFGVKTFDSFPRIPVSAPTADNQATSKKYVDDQDNLRALKGGISTQKFKIADGTADDEAVNVSQLDSAVVSSATTTETQEGIVSAKYVSPNTLHEAMIGGIDQSWQDMSASREIDTTYTNTTGRPIMIAVALTDGGANENTNITIDGSFSLVSYSRTASSYHADNITAIIPNGATYKTASATSFAQWYELR